MCVDLGGGTTTLAAFAGGQFMYADGVPVGGGHISFDIARTLSTPLAEAERIKTLYGTLLSAFSDEREVVSFPGVEENEGTQHETTKARLRTIIEPRIETVYGLVAEKLDRAGLSHLGEGRVVLTGGASQMIGLAGVVVIAYRRSGEDRPPAPAGGDGRQPMRPRFRGCRRSCFECHVAGRGRCRASAPSRAGTGLFRAAQWMDSRELLT
ncbi:MAG: hypothetical protein HC868_11125 [Sphingomonadales bacterium]|nr:hypothetical protein [Sphingomonadales bacterium]